MPPLPQDPTGPSTAVRADGKRRNIAFAAKDAGRRQDVHDLGVIIGELLAEQGGPALFETVESARRAAIGAREGDAAAGETLERLVAGLSPAQALDVTRAFSTYFQAVNSAELVHRIRRRRDYLREGLHRQPGGLEDAFFRCATGTFPPANSAMLRRLHVRPCHRPSDRHAARSCAASTTSCAGSSTCRTARRRRRLPSSMAYAPT